MRPQELVEKNILPDSSAAPGIQGAQKDLERHMRADSLEKHIQSRPKPEELVEKGILNGESYLSSLSLKAWVLLWLAKFV